MLELRRSMSGGDSGPELAPAATGEGGSTSSVSGGLAVAGAVNFGGRWAADMLARRLWNDVAGA